MLKKISSQKIFIFFILPLIGFLTGFYIFDKLNPKFESLDAEEMHAQILANRDFAIQKAVETGDYNCCINPPCTMCYMEANQWNNFKAGTCACDDLIAQGKEPCPQCENDLCEKSEEGICKVNPDN